MNTSTFIAKRYFTAKKSKNFIQVLSWVSMIGVAVGTMALVIVLSVFNGLGDVLRSVYTTFDPELKIQSIEGKSFIMTPELKESIRSIEGVATTADVIEDNMLVSYRDQQVVVKVKGMEDTYLSVNKLDSVSQYRGELRLSNNEQNYAIIGAGVAYELGVLLESTLFDMELIYPRPIRAGRIPSSNALNRVKIRPSAVFSVEVNFDENYLITSLNAAAKAIGYKDQRTSIEVYTESGADIPEIADEISALIGPGFEVLDSDEQHAELLKSVKIEKLFAYIAVSFITLIASFNVFFTLSMLAIEKRKDMSVLFAYGASSHMVKQIFLKQGAIIALVGSSFGLILGVGLCLLQQEYGLVGIQMSTSVVQAYPVKLLWSDLLLVGLSIAIIGTITSYRPAVLASKINPIQYLD